MRIAIITEFLYFKGVIEKTILTLTKILKKKGIEFDIYAGVYDAEKTFEEFKNLKVRSFRKEELPSILNTLYLRYKFRNLRLRGYDGYILYGSHTISTAKSHHPNVLWSTRPLAYLYGLDGSGPDNSISYMYGKSKIKKFLVLSYLKFLRILDQREIKGVDKIRTVGILAKRSLEKAYPNKEVEILYAPIDINNYKYISKGKYYLNVARHVPDKNVDRIIKAFQKMPNKTLYQVGDASDSNISKMAKGYKNIHILGFLDEKKLREVVGKSIAMISASENEDYSMNMMESVASGKPTISVSLDRSVKEIKLTDTGILMPNSQPENIIKAIKHFNSGKAEKMRKACEKKAVIFSEESHFNGLMDALGYGSNQV